MATEKCACTDCTCKVEAASAVKKDGKIFCSEACANGHPNGTGCGHDHCNCHG